MSKQEFFLYRQTFSGNSISWTELGVYFLYNNPNKNKYRSKIITGLAEEYDENYNLIKTYFFF